MALFITGNVYDNAFNAILDKATIELWQKGISFDSLLGIQSIEDGEFEFGIDNDEGGIDVYFKISHENIPFTLIKGGEICTVSGEGMSKNLVVDTLFAQPQTDDILSFTCQLYDPQKKKDPKDIQVKIELQTYIDGFVEISTIKSQRNGLFAFSLPETEAFNLYKDEGREIKLKFTLFDRYGEEEESFLLNHPSNSNEIIKISIEEFIFSPDKSHKIENLGVSISTDLQNYLNANDIETLNQVRELGFLGKQEDPPYDPMGEDVIKIDAHAHLEIVNKDISKNNSLIDKGYRTMSDIASTTRAEFVSANHVELGDFGAAAIYKGCVAVKSFATESSTAAVAEAQLGGNELSPFQSLVDKINCNCKDCKSGVSPIAYLADLVLYIKNNLKRVEGSNILNVTLQYLEDNLCQKFADLEISCREMHNEVCQVRLAVEVLKCYFGKIENSRTSEQLDQLERTKKAYRESLYLTLLNKTGTTFNEVRNVYFDNSDEKEKRQQRLADKLGIVLEFDSVITVDKLFIDFPNSPGELTEAKIEEIFGFRDTNRPMEENTPQSDMEKWRKDFVKKQWEKEDWRQSKYTKGEKLIIDPDVISQWDIRDSATGINDLWEIRRLWIDQLLEDLRGEVSLIHGQELPDLEQIKTGIMEVDRNYNGITIDEAWVAGQVQLNKLAEEREKILENEESDYPEKTRLTVDAFLRFAELYEKYDHYAEDPGNPELTLDEWQELFDILVSAFKDKAKSDWLNEEINDNIKISKELFWIATEEPKEGLWPYSANIIGTNRKQPVIDPQLVKQNEVLEEYSGTWNNRKEQLAWAFNGIKDEREENEEDDDKGFQKMQDFVIGVLNFPVGYDSLEEILQGVKDYDDEAIEFVIEDLFMDIPGFLIYMDIKEIADDPNFNPNEDEWNKVYAILTKSKKRKDFYNNWIPGEAGNEYFNLLRPRLPQWRAGIEDRQEWLQAFSNENSAPVIDPDMIFPSDLKNPVSGIAYNTWNVRRNLLINEYDSIYSETDDLNNFKIIVENKTGVDIEELEKLADERSKGKEITQRLRQLDLNNETLNYILRVNKVLENATIPKESERENVSNILVQVWKTRQFYDWRLEEFTEGILLSPDFFIVTQHSLSDFPLDQLRTLKAFRATESSRNLWERKLKSRVDVITRIVDGIKQVNEEAAESELPVLRDGYIQVTGDGNEPFETKAERLAKKLLIETQNNCCAKTTRIALAIEALQLMIWGTRTGKTKEEYPELQIFSDQFAQEWQWIGSYANWRAAMFVFLFPENIAIPALKKFQSPLFREIAGRIQDAGRVTSQMICNAGKEYQEYLNDIADLDVQASCEADTNLGSGCRKEGKNGLFRFFYTFGLNESSGNIYWSSKDLSESDVLYQQSFWERINKEEKILKIAGARAYRIDKKEFIYLSVKYLHAGEYKLGYYTYDLQNRVWSEEIQELELPPNTQDFEVVMGQSLWSPRVIGFFIQSKREGIIYHGRLNKQGEDWVSDFTFVSNGIIGRNLEILDAITTNIDLYLIARDKNSDRIKYRIIGNDYGTWNDVPELFGSNYKGYIKYSRDRFIHLYGNLDFRITPGIVKRSTFSSNSPYYSNNDSDYSVFRYNWNDYNSLENFNNHIKELTGFDFNLTEFHHKYGISWEERQEEMQRLHVYLTEVSRKIANRNTYEERNMHIAALQVQQFTDGHLSFSRIIRYFMGIDSRGNAIVDDKNQGINMPIRFVKRQDNIHVIQSDLADLKKIVPRSSTVSSREGKYQLSVTSENDYLGSYNLEIEKVGNFLRPIGNNYTRITPYFPSVPSITESMDDDDRAVRRESLETIYKINDEYNLKTLEYVKEGYYFLPMLFAQALQNAKYYKEALDWYRSVYNYPVDLNARKIFYGLVAEETTNISLTRPNGWLLDPLNPHNIAAKRRLAYTRFTLQSIIRCLLEYADNEYTFDTAESVARARVLYQAAIDLLELPEMKKRSELCNIIKPKIQEAIENNLVEFEDYDVWRDLLRIMVANVTTLPAYEAQVEVADSVVTIFSDDTLSLEARVDQAWTVIDNASQPSNALSLKELEETYSSQAQNTEDALLSSSVGSSSALELVDNVKKDFTEVIFKITHETGSEPSPSFDFLRLGPSYELSMDVGEALTPDAGEFEYHNAQEQPFAAMNYFSAYSPAYIPILNFNFCMPDNPVGDTLRMHAHLNLFKIRNCMNIAGVKRQLDAYSAATDTTTGMPYIGVGGNLVVPVSTGFQPTPYKYAVIIERARQLVALAQQIESQFLAALEKRDAEYYNLMKARQDLQLSRQGLRLQDLRVTQAEQEIDMAYLQLEKMEFVIEHYSNLFTNNLSNFEREYLNNLVNALALQRFATMNYTFGIVVEALNTANPFAGGNPFTLVGQIASSAASAANINASIFSTLASYQRRREEWGFQRDLASHDIRISNQQIRIAQQQLRIVGQERRISELQMDFAEDTVNFLGNKFTNVNLYSWMSNVLEDVYGYFLSQSTSMARQAENQLAFERQEPPQGIIRGDYWEANDAQVDKRGLTGSALLLQDITRLDQFAFETKERKLQLSKTFSLNQMAPFEMVQFRETGEINFYTLMKYFDEDFPGHYLRLIKRVRVSVIALVPPVDGIKATLTSTGVSGVVVKGGGFQQITVRRDSETIAFTTPQDATGTFELEPRHDMMNPFEGSGVNTGWQLKMPKASNHFDFSTIADVLFTIEYTALSNTQYERQVIAQMDNSIQQDRIFSFRQQFPDQWYDLNHPEEIENPGEVSFKIMRNDFPPNISQLGIAELTIYVLTEEGEGLPEGPGIELKLKKQNAEGSAGIPENGLISTASGGGGGFHIIANGSNSPIDTWKLKIKDYDQIKDMFEEEKILDLILIITFNGTKPPFNLE